METKKDNSEKEILKEEKNIQEVQKYKPGEINWTDEDYYKNSWKRLKSKNIAQLSNSNKLFQLLSSKGEIVGKPQIVNNDVKTHIKLIIKAKKQNKDDLEPTISYKFIDDAYNKINDGYEEEVLEESFWVYDVVENGTRYNVLCKEKLENHETHRFFGTNIKLNHSKEFDKNLLCRGSANFFFAQKFESSIKPMPVEELIPYVKAFIEKNKMEEDIFKKIMFEYIFLHPNGLIYNQPEDYMLLRHAHLLSGKEEGYPLHLFIWGGFGVGKTQELECLDNIFEETILEAANSTPKALVPSFNSLLPRPGFLLDCNRIAMIDELMKMVDNAINNTRDITDVKNQLSNLNFILEHRARRANSGNGNLFCRPTSKLIAMMNPSMKSKFIREEFRVLDASTISRTLPYVKGRSHVSFIENNKLENVRKVWGIWGQKLTTTTLHTPTPPTPFAQLLRSFYVSIYDSCQHFSTKCDQGQVQKVFRACLNLAQYPMKTLWKRRGLHHTKLLLDGIVKFRCLFKDFDNNFEATQQDYDSLERILFTMINNWDYNMSLEGEDFSTL